MHSNIYYHYYYYPISFILAVQATGQSKTRYMSGELAIMKAIGIHEKKQLSIDTITSRGNAPLTSTMSENIRNIWHYLSKRGAKQARGRLLVESILRSAMEHMDPDEDMETMMSSDSTINMLDFAECDDATDMYNCSTPTINQFRTVDSTCNNLDNPLWGAANTAFSCVRPAQYEDGMDSPVGFSQLISGNAFKGPWPSAREVSRLIVKDLPPRTPLSHLFAVWSQVMAHDLGRLGEFDTTSCSESCDLDEHGQFCFPILVNPLDEVYGTSGQNSGRCLPLTRSVGECIRRDGNKTFDMTRQQLNHITHYLDASGVYGSTEEEFAALRMFEDGLMRVSEQNDSNKANPPFGPLLSIDAPGVPLFAFGDPRGNGITPIMAVQTILLREHNRLAKELAIINPCWDDERLFQEARKIVGALVQIVTYEEFLPLLYGSQFNKYIGPYPGYDSYTDATISNEFNTAFRFGHSLISDTFARLDINNNPLPIGPLGIRESVLNTNQYFIGGGTDPLLRGLMQDKSRAADVFVNRVLTTQLFAPSDDSLGQDIASRDIQRGREHGLAPYRTYEKFCKKKFYVTAKFANYLITNRLKYVYGEDGFKYGIDLWVGSQAERHLVGANIGPTLACIMGMTFSNVRNGDRFWWQNPGIFTADQRASLATIKFSKVICDNADNISTIKRNVFVAGGQPVRCSRLSSLDLTLWKDNTC